MYSAYSKLYTNVNCEHPVCVQVLIQDCGFNRCYEAKIEKVKGPAVAGSRTQDTSVRCVTQAFSTTCAVHVEDCEGWWLSGCHGSVACRELAAQARTVLGSIPISFLSSSKTTPCLLLSCLVISALRSCNSFNCFSFASSDCCMCRT